MVPLVPVVAILSTGGPASRELQQYGVTVSVPAAMCSRACGLAAAPGLSSASVQSLELGSPCMGSDVALGLYVKIHLRVHCI